MFTGLIEEIGVLRSVRREGQAMVLGIEARRIMEDIRLGDSISVNGVCLTVIRYDSSSFAVDVMPETYRHTSLKFMQPGSKLNLERAIAAGGRFGGHIVQGHVDSTGTIISRKTEENAVVFTVEPADSSILKYIVSRGSVTVDGISLTVVDASRTQFSVSIIPHTLSQTILQGKKAGDLVNVECDLMGKYVERILQYQSAEPPGNRKSGGLTEQFLLDHGFA